MRVWVDGQCLQTGSRVRGIGRYVQDFLAGFRKYRPDVDLMVSLNGAMPDEAVAASELLTRWMPRTSIHVWHGAVAFGDSMGGGRERALSEIALAHHVACLSPDIAVSASPFEGERDRAVPFVPSEISTIPTAAIFYDAIPLRFAEHYLTSSSRHERYLGRLQMHRRFDLNLCISEFARSELAELVGTSNGVNIGGAVSETIQELIKRPSVVPSKLQGVDYALYVGALDWRKNVSLIGEALRDFRLRNRTKPLSLVIAGEQDEDRLEDLRKAWRGLGLPEADLIFSGLVTDEDLVGLYKAARVAIQPSKMEGFGLSVLEAMTCGTPVLGASAGAVPELLIDASLTFDPSSAKDLVSKIARLLEEPVRTAELVAQCQARAAAYSWSETVARSVAAFEQTINSWHALDRQGAVIDSQKRVLSALTAVGVDSGLVVETMARSEPLPDTRGSVIVDATVTMIEDHGTGIQRVVRSIAKAASAQDFAMPVRIGYSDWDQRWYTFSPSPNGLPAVDKRAEVAHRFSRNDILLMLDSSWQFHVGEGSVLRGLRIRGIPIVSCLYDTIPLRFPAFCDAGMPPAFSTWIRSALSYSSGFVCISRSVAEELLCILHAIAFPRRVNIGYWHLGADFEAHAQSHYLPPESLGYLMVGTIEPRKGHHIALEAFETVWRAGSNARLVIVGKAGWGNDRLIAKLRNHSELGKRLAWIERADDAVLSREYAACDALIAASYAEGFGLPLVEARRLNKAVLASDLPVFREVCAGMKQAMYFEAGSSESLAIAMQHFEATFVRGNVASDEERRWATWAESTEDLFKLIKSEDWQLTYEPGERRPSSLAETGKDRMAYALSDKQRACSLELVGVPAVSSRTRLRIAVRVTNRSDVSWFSAPHDHLGVFLTAKVVSPSSEVATGRVDIPFVLGPGDSNVLAVEIDMAVDFDHVEIEMVQLGVGRIGEPMLVRRDHIDRDVAVK